MLEGVAEPLLAREPVQLEHAHEGVQTLPTGLGTLEEFLPLQRRVDVVSGQWLTVVASRELLRHFQCHVQVTLCSDLAV